MAPTDPEWMLWAKRLRDEHKVLLLRIDESAQTTIQTQALQEQIKELTANSQQLQRRNDALEERILRLEQDSSNQEPTFGLEIKGLKSRITGLEKELHRTSGNSEKAVGEPTDWHPQRHDKYVSRPQVADGRFNFRSRASEVKNAFVDFRLWMLILSGVIQDVVRNHNYG